MTDTRPSVLVSILSWESPGYLANLLENLDTMAPSVDGRASFHIHVLDQGSGDDVRRLILRFGARGANRSVGFLKRNVGFSVGHNHVFDRVYRKRRFDYFVPLNQDVVFEKPGWLDRLVEGMADETVGVGGPTAWQVSSRPGILLEPYPKPEQDLERIYTLQASVTVIRSSMIERFGLFDALFTPGYFEDTDLCRRYVAAGYRLGWIPVEHRHSYMGMSEKLTLRKAEELKARFGHFYENNLKLFRNRWIKSRYPRLTPELAARLWPSVYRPVMDQAPAGSEAP